MRIFFIARKIEECEGSWVYLDEFVPSWLITAGLNVLVVMALLVVLAIILRLRRRKRYDLTKITLADIDQMTGHEFEEYLYVLLMALGYEQTFLTKKSRDFGADLLFYDQDDIKTVVQAKRLSEKLGLTAVQEVYTAKAYYEAENAMIITSTNLISDPCWKLASAAKVRIIDRDELGDIIKAFKRGFLTEAREQIEEPFEQINYRMQDSLEVIEQRRGRIQAGEYFYKR